MFKAVGCGERGNIALYVAIIIPVVFSLAVVAVDVSRFQSVREIAQREADRIALFAAKALPDQEKAKELVVSAVDALPDLQLARTGDGALLLDITSSRIALALEGSVDVFFDLFMRNEQRPGHTLRLFERSEVQLVPVDYAIVIADAVSLRPQVSESWGSEEQWPASGYFRFVLAPAAEEGNEDSGTRDAWPNLERDWDRGVFQRWATQACYNPVYSSLKFAAISLVDVLGASRNNRISLIFTPGDTSDDGCAISRELDFIQDGEASLMAKWLDHSHIERLVSDEACVYFADYEASNDNRYALPAPIYPENGNHVLARHCREPISFKGWGQSYYPHHKLNECVLREGVPLREAIYYHAARGIAHQPDSGNIIQAIEQAYLQLVGSTAEELAREVGIRGNLAHVNPRKIFVFTDRLPRVSSSGLRELLRRLHESAVSLVLVPFVAEELYGDDEEVRERIELEQAIEEFHQLEDETVRVFAARSAEELNTVVVPKLIALGQEFSIKS